RPCRLSCLPDAAFLRLPRSHPLLYGNARTASCPNQSFCNVRCRTADEGCLPEPGSSCRWGTASQSIAVCNFLLERALLLERGGISDARFPHEYVCLVQSLWPPREACEPILRYRRPGTAGQ